MSNAEQNTNLATTAETVTPVDASHAAPVEDKGKGKVAKNDDAMDEDEDEDEEDDEEDDEVEDAEDDDMEEEEDFQEINSEAILPQGRRTRGVRVDYTSAEALKKAGLDTAEPVDGDEED